jgi:hypothetical protein
MKARMSGLEREAQKRRRTMARKKETTYAGMLGDLQRLVKSLTANSADLPHLETSRVKLENLLAQAQEITKQQAAAAAVKQEASEQLQKMVVEGTRLGNALRAMLKEHYGVRAQKLAEFGMQPFRGRAKKGQPGTPGSPETPSAPGISGSPGTGSHGTPGPGTPGSPGTTPHPTPAAAADSHS